MDEAPETALLYKEIVEGEVDYRGDPASRPETGKWRSAVFIIGGEMAERFAFYGISSNLISYLTGPLGQSTAEAATHVSIWEGSTYLFALLGAFVADAFLGRYRMVVVASVLYILGSGILTLSASLPSSTPSPLQNLLLFASIYLVALAQGGHKPCVQAFGADQFDSLDPRECKSRGSFFNWLNFFLAASSTASICIVTYIQDSGRWVLGFGIPCVSVAIALIIFLLGTRTYRYTPIENGSMVISTVGQVFLAATRHVLQQLRFGSRDVRQGNQDSSEYLESPEETKGSECAPKQIQQAKQVCHVMPIWAACLVYAVVSAQTSTLFTKQGSTMDRRIGSNFEVPAAALQASIALTIVFVLPIYECIFVPISRLVTTQPCGITMLQRIGIGLFFSSMTMVVAALVETQRLCVARDSGLLDKPGETVPLSILWLLPQFVLIGIASVFTGIGLLEFFYDQVPDGLRSMGLAFFLSIVGVGSYISGFLISAIDYASRAHGQSWFATNLNRAHLDYFYWFLAGLNIFDLVIFVYLANVYVYKNSSGEDESTL